MTNALTAVYYMLSYTFIELSKSAMQVQSQKAEIFQVGKRNIINQKIMDKWGNAKIALPVIFRRVRGLQF